LYNYIQINILDEVSIHSEALRKEAKKVQIHFEDFFTPQELDRLGRESGFIQRANRSKLTPGMFLDIVVMNSDKLVEQSLVDLCIDAHTKYTVDISKQAMNERFTQYAILLFKAVLERVLESRFHCGDMLRQIKVFNRILIKDSTCFQIDKSLAEYYPGSGGDASKASIRIQFEYDIRSGSIVDLSLNAFNDQDAANSVETIVMVKSGDLIIRDLAYMHTDVLMKIAITINAFFLCRLSPSISVTEKKGDEYIFLNFKELLLLMRRRKISVLEKTVYISEKRFKVNLIIYLLPDQIIEKRLRNKIAKNCKKGKNMLSDEYRARAQFNLMITNTDSTLLNPQLAYTLYKIRWQIELIFKIWKSIANIHEVKKVKKHRLECYIYAKLIFIIMGWQLFWSISIYLFVHENTLLSMYKFFKMFIRKINLLRLALLKKNFCIAEFMVELTNLSVKYNKLEPKKGTDDIYKMILSCIALN